MYLLLESEISKRRIVNEWYNERLSDQSGVRIPHPQKEVESNYSYYPVIFDGSAKTRDRVFGELKKEGIIARKYFYPITNSFECYKNYPTADVKNTPVAKDISDRVLTLPLYPDLAQKDVYRICDVVSRVLNGRM